MQTYPAETSSGGNKIRAVDRKTKVNSNLWKGRVSTNASAISLLLLHRDASTPVDVTIKPLRGSFKDALSSVAFK